MENHIDETCIDLDNMIDVVFKCKLCSKRTSNKDDLRAHIKEDHQFLKTNEDSRSTETRNVDESPENSDCATNVSKITETTSNSALPKTSARTRRMPAKYGYESFDNSSASKTMKRRLSATSLNIDDESSASKSSRKKLIVKVKKPKHHSFEVGKSTSPAKNAKTSQRTQKYFHIKTKVCNQCKSRFTTDNELQLHIDSHYNDAFKCPLCDFTSNTWHPVKIHIETHNDPSSHKCSDCGQLFSSQYSLSNHRRFNHLGGSHICDVCGIKANSQYLLVQHRMKNHDFWLSCPHCSYRYDNQVDLDAHVKDRHLTGYTCKHCKPTDRSMKVKFPTKEALTAHVDQEHIGQKCFFCDKCNYVAKLRHHLDKHINVHTGVKPYGCWYEGCDFRTRDHRNLTQHVVVKHKKPGEMVCRQCRFVTTSQNEWDVHQAMFHMKEHHCNQCRFKSRCSATVRRHKLAKHTATDKKRFPCPQCDYKSNFREGLQKHLLTHLMKASKYKCPICRLTLPKRDALELHLSTEHANVSCQFCPDCSYVAKNSKLLRQHSLTHSKTKPFACLHCQYSSRTKPLLKRHIMQKHQFLHESDQQSATTLENKDGNSAMLGANSGSLLEDAIPFTGPVEGSNVSAVPHFKHSTTFDSSEKPQFRKLKKLSSAQESKHIQQEMQQISGTSSGTPRDSSSSPSHNLTPREKGEAFISASSQLPVHSFIVLSPHHTSQSHVQHLSAPSAYVMYDQAPSTSRYVENTLPLASIFAGPPVNESHLNETSDSSNVLIRR